MEIILFPKYLYILKFFYSTKHNNLEGSVMELREERQSAQHSGEDAYLRTDSSHGSSLAGGEKGRCERITWNA